MAMDSYLRKPSFTDVEFIAKNMRAEDVEEAAAGGFGPVEALVSGMLASEVCYTLVDRKGIPGAMVGVGPSFHENAGAIWLLGTKAIEDNKITFLKYSKQLLARLYDEADVELLHNVTYSKNALHHAWLQWLGFSFLRRVLLPPYNKEFIEFARLKGQHTCAQSPQLSERSVL